MPNTLESLGDLERRFVARAASLGTGIKQPTLEETASFSGEVASYSNLVNEALKTYPAISYHEARQEKERAKATIHFAFDFLALLVDCVKVMDKGSSDDVKARALQERGSLIEEMVLQKASLLETTYLPVARDELAAFHDPVVREELERDLGRALAARQRDHDQESQEMTEQAEQDREEALDDVKHGRIVPHEEVRRRMGF